VHDGAAGRN